MSEELEQNSENASSRATGAGATYAMHSYSVGFQITEKQMRDDPQCELFWSFYLRAAWDRLNPQERMRLRYKWLPLHRLAGPKGKLP